MYYFQYLPICITLPEATPLQFASYLSQKHTPLRTTLTSPNLSNMFW